MPSPRTSGPAVLLLAAALSAGCGGDDATAPAPTPPLVAGTIDDRGGELTHPDVVLTVPANALDGPADLAIHAENAGHPFGRADGPVLRVTGLPAELGAPLTLRLRHGLSPQPGDTLTFFLEEEREGHDHGRGPAWLAAAARDSAGWCIAEVHRAGMDRGAKALADLRAAAAADVRAQTIEGGHYRLLYRGADLDQSAAAGVLQAFESMHAATEAMGFAFGTDDGIWPLDVLVREPAVSVACYIAAPRGAGTFHIHPELAAAGAALAPVVAHEVLHCAQTFYDPRPSHLWGALDQDRLWLDEATAAYVEAITAGHPDYVPLGIGLDEGLAPLAGVAGHPWLAPADYGYGMGAFVHYLCEDPGSGQTDERLAQLYEHFAAHGSVAAALAAVLDPPIAAWCVDLQRKLLENRIYRLDSMTWASRPHIGRLGAALGSSVSGRLEAPDLGAALARFDWTAEPPPAGSALHLRARPRGARAESLPLAAYGRSGDRDLSLLAAGVDSLTLPDWPSASASYDDVFILASRPYATGAGYAGRVELEVSATVVPDLAGIDPSRFDRVSVTVYTTNTYDNGTTLIDDQIMITGPVAWHGGAYLAHSAEDTFRFVVNPATGELASWRARTRYRSIGGNVIELRLAGGPTPLDEASAEMLAYRARGHACCEILSEVFKSYAADFQTPPYRLLTGFACRQSDVSYEGSRISIRFYRAP